MQAVVQFRGSRQRLVELLHQLPAVLAGRGTDRGRAGYGMSLRIATVLLKRNQDAFDVRMRGGTDEAGLAWEPLSAYTVMGRRLGAEDKKALADRTKLLNAAQKLLQRETFNAFKAAHVGKPATPAQTLKDLTETLSKKHRDKMIARGVSAASADAKIAKVARKILTSLSTAQSFNAVRRKWNADTIKTRMELLGFRKVDILNDTGILRNSLSPIIAPGVLSVGTNVPYAKYHHSPKPRKLKPDGRPRLPRRPIVWDAEMIPPAVWQAMLEAAVSGLLADAPAFLGAA